ncbi:hypothetical protein NL676_004502 [Syzygium grande]|nr:hypothetical protein NL676_004502 [Syzygium grande]
MAVSMPDLPKPLRPGGKEGHNSSNVVTEPLTSSRLGHLLYRRPEFVASGKLEEEPDGWTELVRGSHQNIVRVDGNRLWPRAFSRLAPITPRVRPRARPPPPHASLGLRHVGRLYYSPTPMTKGEAPARAPARRWRGAEEEPTRRPIGGAWDSAPPPPRRAGSGRSSVIIRATSPLASKDNKGENRDERKTEKEGEGEYGGVTFRRARGLKEESETSLGPPTDPRSASARAAHRPGSTTPPRGASAWRDRREWEGKAGDSARRRFLRLVCFF